MRTCSSTDRPWLLWVLRWRLGLRRSTIYWISALPKRNRAYSSSLVYFCSGSIRSTYTLWRYLLLWWRWTTPAMSLPLCDLLSESSEKGWIYIWLCKLVFPNTPVSLIALACVQLMEHKPIKWCLLHQSGGTMDSKSPNFSAAETHALLEGVRCHYRSLVG